MEDYEVDIPSYFLCPISMQLMKDPVTLSTGITYDRKSIEKWFFSCKKTFCPVTKQELVDIDLTPNHTLRGLIQNWCISNSSHGVERIPTPKQPASKSHVLKLLTDAKKSPQNQLVCLQRLRSIAQRNQSSIITLQAAGAVEFLVSMVKKNCSDLDQDPEFAKASNEALNILCHLHLSDSDMKKYSLDDQGFHESLIQVLKCASHEYRANAIMALKSAFHVADPSQLVSVSSEIFTQISKILHDKISQQASKSALKILIELCPWGRNRIKVVESGMVGALIELLLDTNEKRPCELALAVLDQLCGCAEGRAELLKHGAGLAIVSKKILRVSQTASDTAVRILSSISKSSANSRVLQEFLQVGVVSKLCLVVQVNGISEKTKERSKKILMMHSRVWKNSHCIPPQLLSFYPSS